MRTISENTTVLDDPLNTYQNTSREIATHEWQEFQATQQRIFTRELIGAILFALLVMVILLVLFLPAFFG